MGSAALFNYPVGAAFAASGATLYISDTQNNLVRVANVASGAVSFLAGGAGATASGAADGAGSAASFYQPAGVALSAAGDALFLADYMNCRLRRVDLSASPAAVTTLAGGACGFADGAAPAARFYNVFGLAAAGGLLYVGDTANNVIRAVNASSGAASTFVGKYCGVLAGCGRADGAGSAATFKTPTGVALDAAPRSTSPTTAMRSCAR